MKKMLLGLALVAGMTAMPFAFHARAAEDSKPDAEGFTTIFNGKDLSGWHGLPDYWSVKDGMIIGKETKENSKQTFLIFDGGNVQDFELHLKFKFATPDGNSGIQFRSKVIEPENARVGGYQADFDGKNGYTGIIYDEAGVAGKRDIMSKRGEKTHWDANNERHAEPLEKGDAEVKSAIKTGDWNDVVLKVQGNHVLYQINGVTTTEMTDESPKALKEGVLAFQLHKGFTMEIQFKDIKLKKL